jgi:L,D-peptidoglycan transpeptidase YkuD (ErfK/YbiS/YcfS/YnhG family)
MIIVKKPGYLIYKKYIFNCSLGRKGIKKKIKEGDGITPYGTFKLLKIFYRADRVSSLKTNLKKIKINKNIGWCDDPNSKFYNKQIWLPHKDHHEKLYRNDNIYDVLIVLNYNMNPIIKGKGSAIFIHFANKQFKPTGGCIALRKKDLLLLLNVIKKNTKIKIQKF